MQVHIDEQRCEGHGRCYMIAPELFQPDEIGNGQVIVDGPVPADLENQARRAVANCPEQAITVTDDESSEGTQHG